MRKVEERKKAEDEQRQMVAVAKVHKGVDKGEGPSGMQEEAVGVKQRKDGYVISSSKKFRN